MSARATGTQMPQDPRVPQNPQMPQDPQEVILSVGRRRILDHLKLRGPSTPAELASDLRLTPAAVRQHLDGLAEEDLVSVSDEHTGAPGRPAGRWSLTRRAHGLFPDRHGELTAQLVEAIREVAGPDVLDEVIATRTRSQQRDYESAVGSAGTSLAARARALAGRRTAEGYMAEVTGDGDDLLLIEHHCPICEAAEACAGFCRAELGVFRAVLGDDVSVERTEHLLAGAARCAYRIRPVSVSTPEPKPESRPQPPSPPGQQSEPQAQAS